MELFACVSIADISVTLRRVDAEKMESSRQRFEMVLHDHFTGRTSVVPIVGENKAILTLAAWIAADETPEAMEAMKKSLYEMPEFSDFLP